MPGASRCGVAPQFDDLHLFSSLLSLNSGFGGSHKVGAVHSPVCYISLLLFRVWYGCVGHGLLTPDPKPAAVLISAFHTEHLEPFQTSTRRSRMNGLSENPHFVNVCPLNKKKEK